MVDLQINKLDISEVTHRLADLPCRQNVISNAFYILHTHTLAQTDAQTDVHIQAYIKPYANIVSISCLEMDIMALLWKQREEGGSSGWETERLQTELCVVIVVKDVSYQGP